MGLTEKYLDKVPSPSKFKDPDFGSPNINKSGFSLSMAQNLYYLESYRMFGDLNDFKMVTEIGGGYGSLFWAMEKAGYKNKYQIVDFPLMHEIQSHWLANVGAGVPIYSTLEDYREPTDRSLLVANFSMNEMPKEDREKVREMFPHHTHIMVQYSPRFDGYDNMKYFEDLVKETDKFQWLVTTWKDDVHPNAYWLRMVKKR